MSLHRYLNENFHGFNLERPLFYMWPIGIRFALFSRGGEQFTSYSSGVYNEEYFNEVNYRAQELFKSVFDIEDDIYIVYEIPVCKRGKIYKSNYIFKQIEDLDYSRIEYITTNVPNYTAYAYKRAVIKTNVGKINYQNILKAVANTDFGDRSQVVKGSVYFINETKNIILFMYDDRGLDIIANNKASLETVYKSYSDWILDYDRDSVDALFNSQ